MVARCEDYQWSSYRARMGLCDSSGLDPYPLYLALPRQHGQDMREGIKNFCWTALSDLAGNFFVFFDFRKNYGGL